MTNPAAERIDALYESEFGDGLEFGLRQGIVAISTLLVLFLSGDPFYAWWGGAYFLTVVVFWRIARPRPGASLRRLWLARAGYMLSLGTFFVCPIYTISLAQPFYQLIGAYAFVGTALFLIQRPDPGTDAVWMDGLCFTFGIGGSYVALQPRLDGPTETLVAGVICGATVFYFLKASSNRLRRHNARRVAERRYARAMKARALGQFVGGVAHDFNNLLTAIIGNLELHEVLTDPEEKRAALRQSRESALRAAMTVKQLLASSGRTRLSLRQTDLGGFVRQMHPLLDDLLEPGIKVEIAVPEGSLLANVDREMLETSVVQLCLNAQDAMQNHGMIRVHAVRHPGSVDIDPPIETAPPYVGIMVEDNGPGVAEEALSKLAEPFYTTKAVGEGSGLGLSAVAGFARQSGGGLLLESEGHGLRASILLPAQ